MFSTPINEAHQLRRQAEIFLRRKEYNQSISCHQQSAEYFAKALDNTTNAAAKESITYQMEHALKQIRVIGMKKKKDEIENSKKSNETQSYEDNNGNPDSIKEMIYRTIEVHDSLISFLGNRESDDENLKLYSISSDEKTGESSTKIIGNKHPKDDSQIIEELKLLSGQLRDAVKNLVVQLEDRNKEIVKLKEIIKTLEKEKQRSTENKS